MDAHDATDTLFFTATLSKRWGGVSRSTIHRLRKEGVLPEPVVVRGRLAWWLSSIQAAEKKLVGGKPRGYGTGAEKDAP